MDPVKRFQPESSEFQNPPASQADERRRRERRRTPGKGHMYVSVAGWICRRECRRRKDDPPSFGADTCEIDW